MAIYGNAIMTGAGQGSGGEILPTDAILKVQAPAGSAVTITKGSTTKSDMGHENADDNSVYDYYFIIHQSQFDAVNAWTVTATLGTDTATDTVIIDTADEYDVFLEYDFYLYRNGSEYVNIISYTTGSGTVTKRTSDIEMVVPSGSNTARVYPDSPIDFTPYSQLICELEVASISSSPLGVLSLRNTPATGSASISQSIPNSAGTHTVVLDVSNVNSSTYPVVSLGGSSGSATYHIKKLYLVE